MNYIDTIAREIYKRTPGDPTDWDRDPDRGLYRIYAVLALTTGEATTNENVHDAWAAWTAGQNPQHQSLILFDLLTPDVQALDQPYTQAIRETAALLDDGRSCTASHRCPHCNHYLNVTLTAAP